MGIKENSVAHTRKVGRSPVNLPAARGRFYNALKTSIGMAVLQLALFAVAVAAPPQLELSTLAGDEHRGELVALDDASLTLKKGDKEVKLPLAGLLGVRFTADAPPKRVDRGLSHVLFRDGSRFRSATTNVSGRRGDFTGGQLGSFSVPRTAVLGIRFDSERSVDAAWTKLLDRTRKRDLLVIKKKTVLDFLEGSVLSVGDKEVKFLLGEDEIPVPRAKVFGVIYADRKTAPPKPVCEVLLHNSGRLLAAKLQWTGDAMKATLSADGEVEIPAEAIREIDFSLGKVRYLSQMEPREVKYTPFFDTNFKYQRDKNLAGGPIRLGAKTYARGLCIHSKTSLVYRTNTDYRRFKAVVGIDHHRAQKGLGDVHLVISDRDSKKVLFEGDVRGTDDPRTIDLDVSQVRDLKILVDFGGDLDISDWLDLADARVTK
jgi:hypothetical protein